jgi:hypothetical protein
MMTLRRTMIALRWNRDLTRVVVTTVFLLSGYVPSRLRAGTSGERPGDPYRGGHQLGSVAWRPGTGGGLTTMDAR